MKPITFLFSHCPYLHLFQSAMGVPALLVYKSGELIGNFVRVSNELGHDFFANDVEGYLLE
jgi:hypothetical protein